MIDLATPTEPRHRAPRHRRAPWGASAGVGAALLLAACAAPAPSTSAAPVVRPLTRAERTNYLETSRYADVVAFIDSLRTLGAPIAVGSIGHTNEGRPIPYVVASRPLVRTAAEARALGRPIVYVQANIHAGEVEGKEALLALLRDLVQQARPNALDSLVLVAVPIYNADGNERLGPQAEHREEQNGPELVGTRANAQGLDLNRDYVKAEAPETRASLAMFDAWDPDVFVDLHTTDGSFHGYALTYSPSLSPAAPLGPFTQDTLLPELQRRVQQRDGYATFPYGNFSLEYGADINTDTTKPGWFTYDHRPRFGTNYYGLRGRTGRIAVLSEAFSHDPFERRVKSTYAFVKELLSLVAERGEAIRRRTAHAAGGVVQAPDSVPVRAELTRTPVVEDVVQEDLVRTGDSSLTQPGVPRGLRRTGHFRTLRIPVYDRFTPTLFAPVPAAYVIEGTQPAAVELLHQHGIRTGPVTAGPHDTVTVEEFVVDSTTLAARPFQGHHEARVFGHWRAVRRPLAPGSTLVSPEPAALAAYLLEPESDDGFVTWNIIAPGGKGSVFPVVRLEGGRR